MTVRRYTFSGTPEIQDGDPLSILTGGDELGLIAQAVLISLLSNGQAEEGDPLPVAGDRQGWWADAFANDGDKVGSRLWILRRARLSLDTPNAAREYATEALAWLVTDGLAASVEVEAERLGLDGLALGVTVRRDDGTGIVLRFDDLWSEINA